MGLEYEQGGCRTGVRRSRGGTPKVSFILDRRVKPGDDGGGAVKPGNDAQCVQDCFVANAPRNDGRAKGIASLRSQ